MNKYQEALDRINQDSRYQIGNEKMILQELINKQQKLREHLIEEFNKVTRMSIDEEGRLQRFEAYIHYKNGLRYALDFLDRESANDSTD